MSEQLQDLIGSTGIITRCPWQWVLVINKGHEHHHADYNAISFMKEYSQANLQHVWLRIVSWYLLSDTVQRINKMDTHSPLFAKHVSAFKVIL